MYCTHHLVDANDELLAAEQVDEQGVLAGLALDLTGLVVALGDGGGEVTVGGDHEKGDIGLGGTGDPVVGAKGGGESVKGWRDRAIREVGGRVVI